MIEMLRAVPRCGDATANKLLQQCRVSNMKRVGELSERQRNELIWFLPLTLTYHAASIG